uniref:TIL domain-containing protein n=1 Tax=Romanomermis culicivorax TaxID=13658 RepID=A0A915IQJ1_ROMCU
MVCPRNEVFSNSNCLAIASCQPTCPTSQVRACPMICLHGGCVCEPGYLRDPKRNYTCVAEEQCSKPDMIDHHCPHDEIYSHSNCLALKSCQPACPTSQAHPCPKICVNSGCVCKPGYLRDSKRNYTCVAKERCPKPG